MTQSDIETLAKAIGPVIKTFVEQRLLPLKQEIATLKARPLQKWAGVHVAGMSYTEASLVTKGGSLWVATATTTSTPGEAGGAWRLIVKRGQA
jgi:hypothetical protein